MTAAFAEVPIGGAGDLGLFQGDWLRPNFRLNDQDVESPSQKRDAVSVDEDFCFGVDRRRHALRLGRDVSARRKRGASDSSLRTAMTADVSTIISVVRARHKVGRHGRWSAKNRARGHGCPSPKPLAPGSAAHLTLSFARAAQGARAARSSLRLSMSLRSFAQGEWLAREPPDF